MTEKFEGSSMKSLEEAIRNAILQASVAMRGIDRFQIIYLGGTFREGKVNFELRVKVGQTRRARLIPEKDFDDLESNLGDVEGRLDELENGFEELKADLEQLREQHEQHFHQVQTDGYPMTSFPLD
jgi:flavin-binding protein dodecin